MSSHGVGEEGSRRFPDVRAARTWGVGSSQDEMRPGGGFPRPPSTTAVAQLGLDPRARVWVGSPEAEAGSLSL